MPAQSQIEQIAAGYYSQKLPYHNFNHAKSAATEGARLAKLCRSEGQTIDETVIYLALMFHDAGYHENHAGLGFESKEAYSADIARRELTRLGIEPGIVKAVCHAILCTRIPDGHLCRTVEDLVVRRADVANIGGPYASFIGNTIKLWHEFEQLNHKSMTWPEWRNFNLDILSHYLDERLAVWSGDKDPSGQSKFVVQLRRNLEQLTKEPDPQPQPA